MAEDAVTYSQRLKEAGYRTGYVGKWHASRERGPLDFGYDLYRAQTQVCMTPECRERNAIETTGPTVRDTTKRYEAVERGTVTWPGGDRHTVYMTMEGEFEGTQEYAIAAEGVRTLREFAEGGEPWLLEVHFPDPHDPFKPLREFLEHYPLDEVELPESFYKETFENKPRLLAREATLWEEFGEEQFRKALQHYYAYCEQHDRAVGMVIDALDQSGLAGNTLLVISSDHGENAAAHRLFVKGWTPYEETLMVPMVARWPGVIAPGSRTSALVELHDWAHTFTAVANTPPLPHADGFNLLPLLTNPRQSEQDWPQYRLNCYYGCELLYVQRIAIGQRYKYVFNGFDWDELYDLERDPAEVYNAIHDPEYAEAAQQMRDELWRMMYEFHDPYTQLQWGAARYLKAPRQGHGRREWLSEHLKNRDHPFLTKQPKRWNAKLAEASLS
jgi:arylsulfatase A-like enzyme